MSASSTAPMPQESRDHQLMRIHAALMAMETAEVPTPDDFQVVGNVVNIMETIVAEGWALDEEGLLKMADGALGESWKRRQRGEAIRLDGPGRQAVCAVLAIYETFLNRLSERNLKYAHSVTERRIWEVVHGRGRPGDVLLAGR